MNKLSPRLFIVPAGALAIIAALAQAHGGANFSSPAATTPGVQRATACAGPATSSRCITVRADTGAIAIR
jgi:hypothetical protein